MKSLLSWREESSFNTGFAFCGFVEALLLWELDPIGA